MDEDTIKKLREVGEEAKRVADLIDLPELPAHHRGGFPGPTTIEMGTGPDNDPLRGIRGKLNGVATSIKDYLRDRRL
jgi:hypothetical protein